MGRLAILAGGGALPARLAAVRDDALCISFAGVSHDLGARAQEHHFEKLGTLFAALKEQGVSEVVMAGGMSRPPLDPSAFDPVMQGLAPRLMTAMQGGDDGLLREVIAIFEDQGFGVRGAHDIDPELTVQAGVLAGDELSETAAADSARARAILHALSDQDVGQGAVVERGVCLGIETVQGTDALLQFVASTPPHLRRGAGVFVKAPKTGQDLRVDMPTIGPATVDAVRRAGLGALVLAAGTVMILERDETIRAAHAHGLSLIAMEL